MGNITRLLPYHHSSVAVSSLVPHIIICMYVSHTFILTIIIKQLLTQLHVASLLHEVTATNYVCVHEAFRPFLID